MTDEERDQIRRILVAYQDAATWCEELAELALGRAGPPMDGRHPSGEASAGAAAIARILQHLEANSLEVRRLRERMGIR